jgi:hypothetical protein
MFPWTPPGGWLNFLLPDDSNDLWAAIGAVATGLALFYAARSARQATRALRFEQRPLLYLLREDVRILLRNAGRGVALNVFITDEDGEVKDSVAALPPDKDAQIRVGAVNDGISAGNHIYYQDAEGAWFMTKAVGRGIGRSNAPFSNAFVGSVRRWRLPAAVKKSQRVAGRSAWEHYQQLTSYVTFEGWKHRLQASCVAGRIGLVRWWHQVGESSRLRRYGQQINLQGLAHPDALVRSQWDVDATGLCGCWRGTRVVQQLSCDWINGALVAQVRIGGAADANGILRIDRAAFDRLPTDRELRNDAVRRRFRTYICGLRPHGRFVYSLRLRRGGFGLTNRA